MESMKTCKLCVKTESKLQGTLKMRSEFRLKGIDGVVEVSNCKTIISVFSWVTWTRSMNNDL